MISGRNNSSRCSAYVFTASQWQELEQQLLTFKYIMSGVPVPPELISTVIRNPLTCSSSTLFPHQQSLPFGWGCFQVGYGRKIDPEPGRCRRTDGKKWRCTKEACPDSKYCERHMHRGKNKTKKPSFQVFPSTTNNTTVTPNISATTTTIDHHSLLSSTPSPPTPVNNHLKTAYFSSSSSSSPATSCPVSAAQTAAVYPRYKTQKLQSSSFYPFSSPNDQTPSFSTDFTTTESANQHNDAPPHWFLDPHSYDQQPKKDIRYINEMKGAVNDERATLGPFQYIGYNNISKEGKGEKYGFDDKEDETQKQLLHHFLGD